MPALDVTSAVPDPVDDDRVEAGVYATAEQGAAHGLVVLATGHPYWLEESPTGHRLLIERRAAAVARRHLAAYDQESRRWPPPPIADPWTPRAVDLITPLLWAVVVLGVFRWSLTHPAVADRGVLDASAVYSGGEFWRAVTALFLHADAAHVLANVLSGILIFPAVLSTLGRARGWTLLLLTAVAANLAVAGAQYPEPYRSLGASTAIFAGVGLLTGRAIRVAWRSRHPQRWRAMFVPLAAGLTVLALHGAGGQRVDVGAHLAGFLTGLAGGFLAGVNGGSVAGAPRECRFS
ncbi:rhomboid family intramembrane serine protease [Horticoccus sp. 23ND18S-11]|uniref:rhomboid family intramembrane serine protease n=1 Tax=Horticoccus sp. 23ND18S-11 TaxID=3391832 RepID=UPI0039C8D5C4